MSKRQYFSISQLFKAVLIPGSEDTYNLFNTSTNLRIGTISALDSSFKPCDTSGCLSATQLKEIGCLIEVINLELGLFIEN